MLKYFFYFLKKSNSLTFLLLACRSLAYLLEALPGSGATLVSHQTIPTLCAKLLNIEYIYIILHLLSGSICRRS